MTGAAWWVAGLALAQTADEEAQVLQMTRKVNALFESWIREHPDQWMCTKRRWPKRVIPDWLR